MDMSIIALDLDRSFPPQGPSCAQCNGPTRLIGIEPHPTRARTDLRTYQCLVCEHVQAKVIALAR